MLYHNLLDLANLYGGRSALQLCDKDNTDRNTPVLLQCYTHSTKITIMHYNCTTKITPTETH